MCEFFSCLSNGAGEVYYFDAVMRKRIIVGETEYQDTDSHTSTAHHFGFRGKEEDGLNRWEYDVLTGKLAADQINTTDDREQVLAFLQNLDWKTVVPELVIKPIAHPFTISPPEITEKIIGLLQQWDSVRASVRDSVRDSVWAYISSFFSLPKWSYIDHEPGTNPFQSCIDLWEMGLVPSFDGTTWRLHGGPDGAVLYEWKPE